jgi:hypothetical protein
VRRGIGAASVTDAALDTSGRHSLEMQQQAQAAWDQIAPQMRALASKASAAVKPVFDGLSQKGAPTERLIEHLRTADNPTLATYGCGALLAALYLNYRREDHSPLPRRRLFLAGSTVRHSASNGADTLAERGVIAGDQVLIAARAMEAVEIWSFCSLLRAECNMIDGKDDGSSVAFALRVRPVALVYDTDVIAASTVNAISKALKDNGCKCGMFAVSAKADPSHATYGTVFSKAVSMRSSPALPNRGGANSPGSFSNGKTSLPPSTNDRYNNMQKIYAYDAYASNSQSSSGKKPRDSSDVFSEFGNAVVGLFGGRNDNGNAKETQGRTARTLDSSFNDEVKNRMREGQDGKPLLSL